MSEMREHVASALDKAIRAWLGDTGDWLLSEHLDDDDAKRFLDGLACVAIETMREPTEAMLDRGYDFSSPIDGAIAYGVVSGIWRAMSDAALVSEMGAEE